MNGLTGNGGKGDKRGDREDERSPIQALDAKQESEPWLHTCRISGHNLG